MQAITHKSNKIALYSINSKTQVKKNKTNKIPSKISSINSA